MYVVTPPPLALFLPLPRVLPAVGCRCKMADEESKKLAIINEILRLESSTNDALRSSRDEIERLGAVANQKKSEVEELERELSALLEIKTKKKKRIPTLRPKRLRRLTISSAGDVAEEAMFRRGASDSTKWGDSASIVDDNASCTFTVATFDKTDDMELASLWNTFQSDGGDASTFLGGGSVISNGASYISNVLNAKYLLAQKQTLLTEKQAQLGQYQQLYDDNAKKLQQLQQQLSIMQCEQSIQKHNSTIASLNKTKSELISRIRWRENRILEEEKNLAELKEKLAAAKKSKRISPRCQSQEPTSEDVDNEALNELIKLTTDCSELLTNFSSSIFKMIESTITLPPHSSVSYSIADMSGMSTSDMKKKDAQQMDNDKSSLSFTANESKNIGAEEQEQLDKLQKLEQEYDAKIQLIQDEINTFQSSHQEEIDANQVVLDEFQNHVTTLHERLMEGGAEIKRLVAEVEILSKKEHEFLHATNVYDEE